MFIGIHVKTEKERLIFAMTLVNSGQNALGLTFSAYFEFETDLYSSLMPPEKQLSPETNLTKMNSGATLSKRFGNLRIITKILILCKLSHRRVIGRNYNLVHKILLLAGQ